MITDDGKILDPDDNVVGIQTFVTADLWYWDLTGDIASPQMFGTAGAVWEYRGQHLFEDPPPTSPIVGTDRLEDISDMEVSATRLATVRVDAFGREWGMVHAFDAEHIATADVPAGEEEAPPDPTFELEPEDDGTTGTSTPMSWDTVSCARPSYIANHTINGSESRQNASFNSDMERASVLLSYQNRNQASASSGQAWECSGVLIGTNYVLTNAHCVMRPGGGSIPAYFLSVCTHGNDSQHASDVSCSPARSITVNPNYHRGSQADFSDDFAVVELIFPVTTSSVPAWISRVDPKTWSQHTNWSVAYGGFTPGRPASCAVNFVGLLPQVTYHTGFIVRDQWWQVRADNRFTRSRVRTRFDLADGASGSGYFYCPQSCGTNPFIIGLHAYWHSGVTKYNAGPRADRFRRFALDNQP